MFNAINLDYNMSDDENLSYVYFDFGNFKYFTISINKEEDEFPYIELNEQTYSIQSKNFNFNCNNYDIEFLFDLEIKNALCLNENLLINLKEIDSLLIKEMINVLNYILS